MLKSNYIVLMVKFTQLLPISKNYFSLYQNRARQPDDETAAFLLNQINH